MTWPRLSSLWHSRRDWISVPLWSRALRSRSKRIDSAESDTQEPALERLEVHRARRSFLRIARASTNTMSFAVHDTGIGISEHQQGIIFEAFRQADGSTHRKYGGTGSVLRFLAILARLLGGDISVQSTVGQGSSFTLTLPISSRRRHKRARRSGASASAAESVARIAPAAVRMRPRSAPPRALPTCNR
jgi:hypothetical protein